MIVWLLNLPVFVATIVALWISIRAREGGKAFIAASTIYVVLNVLVLWILPIVVLVKMVRAG